MHLAPDWPLQPCAGVQSDSLSPLLLVPPSRSFRHPTCVLRNSSQASNRSPEIYQPNQTIPNPSRTVPYPPNLPSRTCYLGDHKHSIKAKSMSQALWNPSDFRQPDHVAVWALGDLCQKLLGAGPFLAFWLAGTFCSTKVRIRKLANNNKASWQDISKASPTAFWFWGLGELTQGLCLPPALLKLALLPEPSAG